MTDGKPVRILIVEDHEIARLGLTCALEDCPNICIVGEAADGQTGARQAISLVPDVVLMDLGLPVLDGINATKQIKSEHPEIKVLILTTHDTDQDVFAALGAGADGYCIKTISIDQLLVAIMAVAEGAAWLDPAIAGRVLRATISPQASIPASKPEGPTTTLSAREMEILQLLVDGLSNQQMADRLVVSVETVKTHMRHVMEKLCVSDRTQAAIKAMKSGLVSPS